MATDGAVAVENQIAIFHRAIVIDQFHGDIALGAKRIFQDALLHCDRNPGPKQIRLSGKFLFAHAGANISIFVRATIFEFVAKDLPNLASSAVVSRACFRFIVRVYEKITRNKIKYANCSTAPFVPPVCQKNVRQSH